LKKGVNLGFSWEARRRAEEEEEKMGDPAGNF